MRVICYLIIVLLIYSCGSGGGPSTYEQVNLLEYNIKSKSKRIIKAFGENETSPYVRYFNKTNGFVYGRYSQFNVFNEAGKEKIVKIDSMLIGEYFSISPDDKDLIFCATIHSWSPSTADVYRDRGLYRLNLETYAVSLIYKDSLEIPQYPIFSHNGGLILFKTSTYQGWPSHIYMINRNGENKVKIASNDYDLIKYGFFNSDDTKLYFLECPDKVYQYDIINKKLDAIINSLVFDKSVSYPFINVHGNYLYFILNIKIQLLMRIVYILWI